MNVCEKIDAFEKHVFDRQLRIAEILGEHFLSNPPGDPLAESAFAIVSICFSYFEMIEQFSVNQSSKGRSPEFFKRGFRRVFPDSIVNAEDIASLYSMIRCGMYHTAMPTDRCGLSRELPTAIANESGVIVINPALLVHKLIQHFRQYCSDLRDGCHCELQYNFEQMFNSFSLRAKPAVDTMTRTTPAPCLQ